MKYYAGCDVSLEETFVSIINEAGQIVKEGSVASESGALCTYLKQDGLEYERIGIESGQLSIVLCKGLKKEGLPVMCVDARHMAPRHYRRGLTRTTATTLAGLPRCCGERCIGRFRLNPMLLVKRKCFWGVAASWCGAVNSSRERCEGC